MVVLQSLPLPSVGLCTDVDLYVRAQRGAWYSFEESAVLLQEGGLVSTDTYFGLIPVGKWFRHTTIRQVDLVLNVEGDVEVEAVHNRMHHAPRIVATGEHRGGPGELTLTLPSLDELVSGHVFVKVRSRRGDSRLTALSARTEQAPPREAHLGVGITTFNRQPYVRGNIARVEAFAAHRPDVGRQLRVLVVDNAQNLEIDTESLDVTRVVPNRNLGGAGGFARCLMEHRDEDWATHVMFMDDDITFEPELLARTISLLSYAVDPKLCIGGAMLTEEFPNHQFEAGANIATHASHIWNVVGGGRNLHLASDLLCNDEDESFDYGGWWCYTFPIDLTDDYPLPIFVRGDDVCFGLRYGVGHQISMNGIGVWHQHFAMKNGPALFFYECRNVPIVLTVTRPDYCAASVRRRLVERTVRFASAMKYDSATAVLDGVEAFLDGPEALLAVPADDRNAEVRARYGEAIAPLPDDRRTVPTWAPPRGPLPALLRGVSLLTLGGHLMPASARRGQPRAVTADATPAMAMVGADEIVYRHDATGDGFVAHRDQVRFREIMRRLRLVRRRVNEEFDTVAEAWRAAYPKLVSDEYWREQFERPS